MTIREHIKRMPLILEAAFRSSKAENKKGRSEK